MPLNTAVLRDGETVKLKWSYFTLSCMLTAAMQEGPNRNRRINQRDPKASITWDDLDDGEWVDWSLAPIYFMDGCPLLEKGEQVLKEDHTFDGGAQGAVEFKSGDVLQARRGA